MLGAPLMQGRLKQFFYLMNQLTDAGFIVLKLKINRCVHRASDYQGHDHRCDFLELERDRIKLVLMGEGCDDFRL